MSFDRFTRYQAQSFSDKTLELSDLSARTGILSVNTMVSGIIRTRTSIIIRVRSIRTNCVRPCHIG